MIDDNSGEELIRELVETAKIGAIDSKNALLEFAKTNNPKAEILPQIMISDYLPRKCLVARTLIKRKWGEVVLKQRADDKTYSWMLSDGWSVFIDLGISASSIAEAKQKFSEFFKGNADVEIWGNTKWWKELV